MQTPVIKSTSVNLTLTESIYKPLTINLPFESLLIDLGLAYNPIEMPTVCIFKVENEGNWAADIVEVSARLTKEEGFDTAFRITLQEGTQFEEGEMYKLAITYIANPDAAHTAPFTKTEISYIAVNYTHNGVDLRIAALQGQRKMVICISDIHMGQNDLYSEFNENKKPLTEFLQKVHASPNVSELVIAGDLIDGWIIPATEEPNGGNPNITFAETVENNNQDVFAALNTVCENDAITTTYIPGNHDLIIDKDQISKVLPKINQARDAHGIIPGLGLGSYSPKDFPNAIIEHGHRYNFFCAPCLPVKNDPDQQSILPPGYLLTRIGTEAFCHPRLDGKTDLPKTEMQYGDKNTFTLSQYSAMCISNLKVIPVKYGPTDKFIKTDVGGLVGEFSMEDLVPHLDGAKLVSKLYKTISDSENWNIRQEINNVNCQIPVSEAILLSNSAAETDSMANVQYFAYPGSQKTIVVFGHSHEPRIVTYPTTGAQTGIYANTGTWIDINTLGMTTMTFVALIANKTEKSAPQFVNLYQYTPDGKIVLMDSQATVNFTENKK